jgi:hypothetical protein
LRFHDGQGRKPEARFFLACWSRRGFARPAAPSRQPARAYDIRDFHPPTCAGATAPAAEICRAWHDRRRPIPTAWRRRQNTTNAPRRHFRTRIRPGAVMVENSGEAGQWRRRQRLAGLIAAADPLAQMVKINGHPSAPFFCYPPRRCPAITVCSPT